MEINPTVKVARFEQLEPGDLFIFVNDRAPCYAIKSQKDPKTGDPEGLVILGPQFPYDAEESFLMPWRAASALCFGKNYTVLLPTQPSAWKESGSTRGAVHLAVSEEQLFICTNAGLSPQDFHQAYVEMKTGRIVPERLGVKALLGNHRAWPGWPRAPTPQISEDGNAMTETRKASRP
jgi:hypothetical protein